VLFPHLYVHWFRLRLSSFASGFSRPLGVISKVARISVLITTLVLLLLAHILRVASLRSVTAHALLIIIIRVTTLVVVVVIHNE
jgi:glycerol-3-phosphate acyltransferase PlsY